MIQSLSIMAASRAHADISILCRPSTSSASQHGDGRRVFQIPTEVMYMIDPKLVSWDGEAITASGSRPLAPSYRGRFLFSSVVVKALSIPHTLTASQMASVLEVLALVCGVSHPNTVPTIGVVMDEPQSRVLIVSEVMEETTLFDAIRSDQMTNSRLVTLHYAYEVANAMARLHDLGLVHGNLHPHNVLFDDRNKVRVSNFAMVQLLIASGQSMADVRAAIHPLYAAPEVYDGTGPVFSFEADAYSLAVIVWSCFFLSYGVIALPYNGDRSAGNPWRPPGGMDRHAPPDVVDLLAATFAAKSPSDRPSARDFADLLYAHVVAAQEELPTAWALLPPETGATKMKSTPRVHNEYSNSAPEGLESLDRASSQAKDRVRIRRLQELTARLQANAGIRELVIQHLAEVVEEFPDGSMASMPVSATDQLTRVTLHSMKNVGEVEEVVDLGLRVLYGIANCDGGKVSIVNHWGHYQIAMVLRSVVERGLATGENVGGVGAPTFSVALRLLTRVAYNDGNRDVLRTLLEGNVFRWLLDLLRGPWVRGEWKENASDVVCVIAFLALSKENKELLGELGVVEAVVELMEYWWMEIDGGEAETDFLHMEGISSMFMHGYRGLGNLCVYEPNGVRLAKARDGYVFVMIGEFLKRVSVSILEENPLMWISPLWCLNSMTRTADAARLVPTSTAEGVVHFQTVAGEYHYRVHWIIFSIYIRLCVRPEFRVWMRSAVDVDEVVRGAVEGWASDFPAVAVLGEAFLHDVWVEDGGEDGLAGIPSLDGVEANASV